MTPRSQLATHPASRALGRNVLAIASGKGGVGKTWLAVTLSHALARAGRRVLLLDADLGLANVDIQIGLTPERDLESVMAGSADLAAAVTRYGAGGFDVLAGRSGSGALAALPAPALAALCDRFLGLALRYDTAIMDLGAGVENHVRALAAAARTCLVVTTDEPTAITDAYAFIKLAHQRAVTADLRVVVNMVQARDDGLATFETLKRACESFLKFAPKLAGVIRRDPRVRESIRSQKPLLARHPEAAAAADVEQLRLALDGWS